LLKKSGWRTQKKTSAVMEDIKTLIILAETKPAESLLHDDKADNDDKVFNATSVCENHGVYMRELDRGYL